MLIYTSANFMSRSSCLIANDFIEQKIENTKEFKNYIIFVQV